MRRNGASGCIRMKFGAPRAEVLPHSTSCRSFLPAKMYAKRISPFIQSIDIRTGIQQESDDFNSAFRMSLNTDIQMEQII